MIETNNVVERLRAREAMLADYSRTLEGEDDIALNVLGNDLRDVQADVVEAADLIQSLSDRIDVLDAECERAWESYRIAVDQAMANGQALADLRASLTQGGKNG